MSSGPRYRVGFRRRREGKTDFRYRLRLLNSGKPRAVVRLSRAHVLVSITEYDPVGDRVRACADSRELPSMGFPSRSLGSTPAAYLTGYLAGIRAKRAGTEVAVLDAGLRHPSKGGRLLSALKGLLDSGLVIPHGEGAFPTQDRLSGSHLSTPLPSPLETYRGKLSELAKGTTEEP